MAKPVCSSFCMATVWSERMDSLPLGPIEWCVRARLLGLKSTVRLVPPRRRLTRQRPADQAPLGDGRGGDHNPPPRPTESEEGVDDIRPTAAATAVPTAPGGTTTSCS